MANMCSFTMKIKGKKEDIQYLLNCIPPTTNSEQSLSAIYEFKLDENSSIDNGFVSGTGTCSRSVSYGLLKYEENNLVKLTKDKKVVVEIFGEETGLCFQEHSIVKSGKIQKYKCVDYECILLEDYDSLNELNQQNGLRLSLKDFDSDGRYEIGGFKNWQFSI